MIDIKYALRQVMPPVVISGWRLARRALREMNGQSGGFRDIGSSWPAKANANWDNKDLFSEKLQAWDVVARKLSDNGPVGFGFDDGNPLNRHAVSSSNLYMSYAYALAKVARAKSKVRVLDYGGALGQYYLLSRSLFPEIDFEYHCREVEAAVGMGRAKLPDIQWHSTDDCLARNYDLVHIGSSLQYAESWKFQLQALCGATASHIFFGRTPITANSPTFCARQLPDGIPFWCFNEQEFVGVLETQGFRLSREFSTDEVYPIEGSGAIVRGRNLLFEIGH